MMIPKAEHIEDRAHLDRVGALPCMINGCWNPAIPHHLMRAEQRGTGYKTGDNWAVPLCSPHHDELHRHKLGEIDWFKTKGWRVYQAVKDYATALYLETLRLRRKSATHKPERKQKVLID